MRVRLFFFVSHMDASISILFRRARLIPSHARARARILLRSSAEHVRFDSFHFRIDGRVVSGLLPRLQKVTGWSSCDPRHSRRMPSRLRSVHRSCPTWGEVHGKLVHSEIRSICESISNLSRVSPSQMRVDPCTERFFAFLAYRSIVPIASELPVGYHTCATAVDFVGIQVPTGDLVAIEIKTNCEGEIYGPLPSDQDLCVFGLRDCPRDRHELQLAATCALMPVRPDRSYLVRLCSKARGVDWREIKWWKNRETEILKLLN